MEQWWSKWGSVLSGSDCWVLPKTLGHSWHSLYFSVSTSSFEADVRMLGSQPSLQTYSSENQEDTCQDGWIPRCKDLTDKKSWGEILDCKNCSHPRNGWNENEGVNLVLRLSSLHLHRLLILNLSVLCRIQAGNF